MMPAFARVVGRPVQLAMIQRRLRRSISTRRIAGVCGGLADFLGLNVTAVRMIWLPQAVAGGGGLLAYLPPWIVVPEASVGTTHR